MKPLHTQLLPKKSTSSPSKISGSPPLISSWSRSSLMLLSEFLRWLLHEERESPYQYQLQTSVFRRRVTSWAVIFQATNHYQNPFSFLNGEFFWILLCKIAAAFLLVLKDWDSCNVLGASSANCYELFQSGKLVLKMNLKDDGRSWFGFQVCYQPRKTNFHHQKFYPQSVFKSSTSLLNA